MVFVFRNVLATVTVYGDASSSGCSWFSRLDSCYSSCTGNQPGNSNWRSGDVLSDRQTPSSSGFVQNLSFSADLVPVCILKSFVSQFVGSVWSLVCGIGWEDCSLGRNVSFNCGSYYIFFWTIMACSGGLYGNVTGTGTETGTIRFNCSLF